MMKKIMMITSSIIIAGCVSVEGTREQLKSKDSTTVNAAEERVYNIGVQGKDPCGINSTWFVPVETPQQVEYVKLLSNSAVLAKIISEGGKSEVVNAAAERFCICHEKAPASETIVLYFRHIEKKLANLNKDLNEKVKKAITANLSGEDVLEVILRNRNDIASKVLNDNDVVTKLSAGEAFEILSKSILGDKDSRLLFEHFMTVSDSETMAKGLGPYGLRSDEMRDKIAGKILTKIEKEKNISLLLGFRDRYDGRYHYGINKEEADRILLTLAYGVSDEKTLLQVMEHTSLVKGGVRVRLLKQLPEEKMLEKVFDDVNGCGISSWNEGKIEALESAMKIGAQVKDKKVALKIYSSVFQKISYFMQECNKNEWMKWTENDEKMSKELASYVSGLSDLEMAALLCLSGDAYVYLLDKVSAGSASVILTKGKSTSEAMEEGLVKLLPKEKITVEVFSSLKGPIAKKTAMGLMSDDVRKEVEALIAERVAAIMKKSEEASKTTFAFKGFYLGMSMEEVREVYLYHFPAGTAKVDKDGLALYIDGQLDPLCRMYKDSKGIYELNFGSKMLKKWYKYDAATAASWAEKYGTEYGIDMSLVILNERDKDGYGGMYSLVQDTYQSKNAKKEYRIIYYGEPDYNEINGIMTAQSYYSRRSCAEGTLRVQIERD
ncbi:MAG: hypothetical protein J6Q84_04710 [Kiritimatiellae bacterium]|nr:hypothetical protein [Kiritimatiellia bacterium]